MSGLISGHFYLSFLRRAKIAGFAILYVLAVICGSIVLPVEKTNASSVINGGASTTAASSTTVTSLNVSKPSGVVADDYLVAAVAVDNTGATITPPTDTAPYNWQTVTSNSNASGPVKLQTFIKRAHGSEPASYTFNTTSARIVIGLTFYRGVDTSSPLDTDITTRQSGSPSTNLIANGVTTAARSKNIAVFSINNVNKLTFIPALNSDGYIERVDNGTTDGAANDVSIEMIDKDQPVNAVAPPNVNSGSSGTGGHWATQQFSLKAAAQTHMMLFWDGGGAAPTGWSYVTEAEGKFLRGEAAANYSALGGQNDHNHSMTTPTLGLPNSQRNGGGGNGVSAAGHTHGMPATASTAATNGNIPSFSTLRLIRYDAGIPNTIPAGGIAIFDNSPGIPATGWTRLSSQDAKVVKIDAAAGSSGGVDTHTHSISWSGSLTATGVQEASQFCLIFGCDNTAPPNHTHTVSGTATTSSATSNLPPYIQPLLAKANVDTSVLSIGLTAMFDNAPGGGWVVRSDSGGPYYRKFMRPNTTYSESGGGAEGHTPTGGTKTSGAASGSDSTTAGGSGAADISHTHVITPVFTTYTSDSLYTGNNEYFLPPFYNVVVAEKVNFIFNRYAWYDDPDTSGSNTVSSRYSSLDVAEDGHIVPVPVGYNPPDLGQDLRLRIQVLVNNSSLAAAEMQFRLQFKEDTSVSLTTSTCTDGTWTDIGNSSDSTVWRYADSTNHPTDGGGLTGASIFSTLSSTMQRYVRSTTAGTNIGVVNSGETMEWDYHIVNNGASPATQYRFRLVEDSGILLSQYGRTGGGGAVTPLCPTLTTRPHPENQLRHGNFFDNTGNEKGFSWVD